jgi:hypothetical protein
MRGNICHVWLPCRQPDPELIRKLDEARAEVRRLEAAVLTSMAANS